MKKTSTLIALALLFTLHAKAQLSWLPLAGAPKSYRLDDFYFLNPQKGWAVSPSYDYLTPHEPGRIFTTNDGGVNWKLLVDGSKTFFRSIGFADSLNGWVGNLADSSATPDTIPFYHTIDGGKTWNPVTNIPNPKPKGICGISVVTDSVIYAYGRYYGPPVLLKTIDKGATWTSQDMSAYASGLVDAHFFSKDTGFVTGCYGDYKTGQQKALILSTFDGGASWQIRHQSNRVEEEVWKIFFPSRKIGYGAIEYQDTTSSANTYFLKTTDGGLTWTDMPFLSPGINYDIEGVGFINDTVGWIGGDVCYPTYKTTDGGLTWNPDISFGKRTSYYECAAGNTEGIALNRFRRFGDTLMYASGFTVCKLSAPQVPIPHFHASNRVVCAGSTITFSDSTTNTRVSGWQWNFPGGSLVSGSTLTDSMPKVIYPLAGTYAVSYTASTSAGHASITETSYIHVEPAIGTYSTSFTEGFETASIPGTDWNVWSSKNANWMLTSAAAASGVKSVMINNITNSPGDTSILTSPTFDLAAIGSSALSFAMSYQQKATTNTDKLMLYVSTDCGISWVSKWSRTGTALQPSSVLNQSTSPFIPNASEFTTYTVNLGSVVGASTNAVFRWIFCSGTSSVGNNIYLDDINVFNSTSGIQNIETTIDLTMYPNPSLGSVNIAFNLSEKHNIAIQVVDMLGRLVEKVPAQIYTEGESNITIGNKSIYQSGVYFVQVNVDGQSVSKKIIMQ